jgi:flagellar basal-body rod protein FlgF
MIKGIYTAARSLEQHMQNIDVIANNLANLNTTGYKREIPFSEVVNKYGDILIKKLSSQQQGEVVQTSNPLDLAISGKGFFTVKNNQGALELTRDGRFKISDEGFLVDNSGNKVLGENGEISLDETALAKDSTINISKNGEIKLGDKVIDSLQILNVNDSSQLVRAGSSNFSSEGVDSVPANENDFAVSQGFLEESNTNPMTEMEEMIKLNKEYESAQKVIAALDTSLSEANEIGKIS